MNSASTSSLRQVLSRTPSCCQRRFAHKLVEVELQQNVPNLGLRGDRLPISPGRARNDLLPRGQALYVVKGKTVSPLRDMMKRELARVRTALPPRAAPSVPPEILEDPHAVARAHESTLLAALSLLPPLTFHRRLIHPPAAALPGQPSVPTSTEIYGSVSMGDIVSMLREYGVVVEEVNGGLAEGEGVDKGRIKAVGWFDYTVQLRTLGETFVVKVEVVPEV